jgi:tetratricopeptide (TPR) repeat protein
LNYAEALGSLGEVGAAVTNYQKVLQLDPQNLGAMDSLALLLATCPDNQWRNQHQALGLARQTCDLTRNQNAAYLGTLAQVYAADGQFSNAVATAELALSQARERGSADSASQLERNLAFYRAGKTSRSE